MKFIPEELINKYNTDSCSEEERVILESWHIKELSKSTSIPSKKDIDLVHQRMHKILSLHTGYHKTQKKTIRLWFSIKVASILLIVSITLYLNLNKEITSNSIVTNQVDISPGGNKATLILSNGIKIILSKTKNGLLAKQGNIEISKKEDGKLIYSGKREKEKSEELNRLETPRSGQYQITLNDNTKVWLNSASTLIYPTVFTGTEREVKLIGEAYFEVSKNQSKPFKVISGHQIIEVLGTHFNVFAYPDEKKIQTTLLEGKVKVYNHVYKKILNPGQEALTDNKSGSIIQISNADIEKNLAWKNNEFIFNGENLESIMRLISRWYNVEIVYCGHSDQTKYWGVISRSKNLSAVLKMLQSTGKADFKIEGRRIIVMY